MPPLGFRPTDSRPHPPALPALAFGVFLRALRAVKGSGPTATIGNFPATFPQRELRSGGVHRGGGGAIGLSLERPRSDLGSPWRAPDPAPPRATFDAARLARKWGAISRFAELNGFTRHYASRLARVRPRTRARRVRTTKQCATGRQPLGNEIAPERWNHFAWFPIGGSDQAGLAGAGFVASGARLGLPGSSPPSVTKDANRSMAASGDSSVASTYPATHAALSSARSSITARAFPEACCDSPLGRRRPPAPEWR